MSDIVRNELSNRCLLCNSDVVDKRYTIYDDTYNFRHIIINY